MSPHGEANGLRVSYSGVRGIYGESLTTLVAARFAEAFARLATRYRPKPTVIIGRDTRPSGEELLPAVIAGLTRLPCSLIDVGVVPSPTVQVAMAELGAQAAIIVTASHNPPEWNGFKFLIGPHNIVLNGEQTRELFQLSRDASREMESPQSSAAPSRNREALDAHLRRVLDQVDVEAIKRRRFKVAVDSCLGAGEEVTASLADALGCTVVPVRVERNSEPVAAHLGALRAYVVENECDIGVAQDLDADRLALVTETGEAIGEECTLAFAVDHLLRRFGGAAPVVVRNSSTSRMIDDLCAAHGAELREVRVGEVNLSQAMIELTEQGRTVFGGEGNGGVIYPPVCFGRDSLIGIALILEYAARAGRPLSELHAALPQYHIIKRKLEGLDGHRLDEALARVKRLFAAETLSEFDGLKFTFSDGAWCQVRPSNTEPIVRVIAEARSPATAEQLYRQVESEVAPLLHR
ncbi:MAG: phosphoglucosamine mutase [Armatimonadota bacterium]|nr:MAG: phosphoglucosamine mutase [Armatimonadota bacterium]